MNFADIHIHALCGSDDGADSKEEMFAMIDAAYGDGARYICLTPHYHIGYYGHNRERSERAFEILSEYVFSKYSDLRIALGNELHYEAGCEDQLSEGMCRTLNKTEYVLVDFSSSERKRVISAALDRLLNIGYRPILAHTERYTELLGETELIGEFRRNGVLIQLDTGSLLGDFGRKSRRFAKALLARRLVDIVSSDAHNTDTRPVGMKPTYEYIKKKYGQPYADKICCENARCLIFEAPMEEK